MCAKNEFNLLDLLIYRIVKYDTWFIYLYICIYFFLLAGRALLEDDTFVSAKPYNGTWKRHNTLYISRRLHHF